jgi:hypothetical protein
MYNQNTPAFSNSHNNCHEELARDANITFTQDETINPPSPIPSNYPLAASNNSPSPMEVGANTHKFIVDTNNSSSYFFNATNKPMTLYGEGRQIGIGDQILLRRDQTVVWTIVCTLTWDQSTVVLHLESGELPHILLEVKKEWMCILTF